MGLGCKLIGHRKAQNIQWCSAFIPNWTGPCCRAKRWLISTLKLAWTVVSTVKRIRGGRQGPLRQHPFDSNPILSDFLPRATSKCQRSLSRMPAIQHTDSGKRQQSEKYNHFIFFCPINMNLKVSLRTWNRWMCEELHVKQMETMNYNNCFSHMSFCTASVVLTRLNFSTEVTTIIYSPETQLEKWQRTGTLEKKAEKTLAVCKYSMLAQCLSE